MKCCNENSIGKPKSGWIINECNEMEIDYFDEDPYPEHITEISGDDSTDEEDNEDVHISSSNESDDDDWDY